MKHLKILKAIDLIGSEIIDVIDGQQSTDDGGWTNFDFMSSADTVKQS